MGLPRREPVSHVLDLQHPELAALLAALACTLAMLIFLTAAMDNPYRGEFSVSADVYQYLLDHIMAK